MKNLCKRLKTIVIIISLSISLSSSVSAQKSIIDLATKHQTIEGFGASDCWTVQYVGKYWNDIEKEKAARWLFSKKTDENGNPEGIGLSIWRFNIGGGTIEQGDSSNLNTDITRRAECFMDAEGKYDWSKQAGQQWFLKKAKKYGCETFVAFSNTPPVYYTRNGKGYGMKDGYSNLKSDRYADFSKFLINVVRHFKKQGILFNYISPINEPQWDWSASYQEGCPWQNDEIKKILELVDKDIQTNKLNTQLLITEAGSWDNLYEKKDRASDQIYTFFDKESPLYIGNLSSLPKALAGHSYWTDQTHETLKNVRIKLKEKADKYGLKLHQSEWSLLSNPPLEGIKDYAEASYMDIALYMTKVIYSDLVYANVASWSFWTSMDIELWGFKNRFNLIRLETPDHDVKSITKGGKVADMKTLWALGHYSRFIRPGYVRVGLSGYDNLADIFGSAYISPKGDKLVVVFSNLSSESRLIPVVMKNGNKEVKVKNAELYLTNEEYNMASRDELLKGEVVNILPKSIMTVVYSLER